MRTVYLGTSGFAAAVLERLAAGEHRPQLVITRPDRPRGRGRRVAPPPVAEAARVLGLELYQPENVNADEARARIAAVDPEEVVICAFGALIKEPLLSDHPLLNVHPSLLPRWRGAAPVERAIMAGDARDRRLDHAPDRRLGQRPGLPRRHRADRAGRHVRHARPAPAGARLRPAAARARRAARRFTEQPDDGITYAEKIGPDDRTLDPEAPADVNDRAVRALSPHIGARVELPGGGGFLGVLRAAVRDPGEAGPLRADGGRLLLGGLELLEVQPAGGRPMDAAAYLRGHGLPPG